MTAISLVNCLKSDEALPTGEHCVRLLKETTCLRVLSAPLFAQGDAKWFVLRNHEVGNCWTATLVRIDGQYANTFDQKAGGPYDTEAQALDRQRSLENEGACNRE